MIDLTDRVILVTGAGGSLGQAVVPCLESYRARLFTVLAPGEHNPFATRQIFSVVADLSLAQEASSAVETVLQVAGHIDGLVHLVGGFEGGKPTHETSDHLWNQMLTINLQCAFNIIRPVLRAMIPRGRGRILAIGSRTAVEPAPNLCAYNTSKAALVALIRTVALEVKNSAITANVILPSVLDTPANRAANPGADYSKWVKPESVAFLIAFLLSDAASEVTGALIPVYGRV